MKIPIKLIEDHDEAYYFWKKLGLSDRPLIHIDAHVDFNFHPVKPIRQTFKEAKSKKDLIQQMSTNLLYKKLKVKERALTNIGNYIYPGMRDGIVADFYWIVPGDRREFNASLKELRDIMRSFFRMDPFEAHGITKKSGMLQAKIYGRNFVFTTLDDLPENMKGAILDIDTDYLTTPAIRKAVAYHDAGRRFPWIWPDEFVDRLAKKKIEPSCVTIAYSVNGGFTPLVYKFLGDEVRALLNGANKRIKEMLLYKKKALMLFNEGRIKPAVLILEDILEDLKSLKADNGLKKRFKAHIYFVLFRCFVKLKDARKAKFYYTLAVESDKTYRMRDNNYGPLYLGRRGLGRKAEQEYRAVLSADKDNTYALSGLAEIFMRRRELGRAKALFKKSLSSDRKNNEALLGLGRAELSLKNYNAAVKHLKFYGSKNKMQDFSFFLMAQAYEGLKRYDAALKSYIQAFYFSTGLYLYFRLFKLIRRIGIKPEHKGWLERRIEDYEGYRKAFLSAEKRPKQNIRILKTTKRLISRIDRILKNVE